MTLHNDTFDSSTEDHASKLADQVKDAKVDATVKVGEHELTYTKGQDEEAAKQPM